MRDFFRGLRTHRDLTSLSFVRKRTRTRFAGAPKSTTMPKIAAPDGVELHVEEVGSGTPVVFVHEYAGDYRSWEPQVRHLGRQYRCVTYSQRGYSPSDVPSDPARYAQGLL